MATEQGNTGESFLTVAEVAEMLKLNQQTVRNWIDQGSLPAVRIGRRVRIRQSDLDRLLEEGSTGQSASAGESSAPGIEDFWGGGPVGVDEPARSVDEPAHGNDAPAHAGNPSPRDTDQ
jgi:excisionase family DNA binding protein